MAREKPSRESSGAKGSGAGNSGTGGWWTENRPILIRAALYIALVIGLSNVLVIEWVDREVLGLARLGIAELAGWTLNLVGYPATVSGQRVFLSASAVEIVNSCTGVDVGIFLASAVLVFPASWRARAIGVALSFSVVFLMNFARVLTLCYFVNTNRHVFELSHYYVWPGVIIVGCLATLLLWIQRIAQPEVEELGA